MKYLIIPLLCIVFCSCGEGKKDNSSKPDETKDKVHQPKWLLGDWKRVGEKEGNQTYEYWKMNNNGAFIGMGCTLKGTDTIWKENIMLHDLGKGWKFEVTGLGDTIPTVFTVTRMSANTFICENEENDFPKKIEYAFDGKNINAVISGGGPSIPFNFIKMKQ